MVAVTVRLRMAWHRGAVAVRCVCPTFVRLSNSYLLVNEFVLSTTDLHNHHLILFVFFQSPIDKRWFCRGPSWGEEVHWRLMNPWTNSSSDRTRNFCRQSRCDLVSSGVGIRVLTILDKASFQLSRKQV